jgi:predicted lipoprotein with Yx(FWY)xxD motif
MRSTHRLWTAAAACAVAAAALAGTVMAASSAPIVKTSSSPLGRILVDGRGHTLYLFERDKSTKSTCYGKCATFWPPLLTTAKATAGAGAKASLLGTTKRSDGKLQVTYHGHPLYFFVKDTKAGTTAGQNLDAFGGEWYVLSAAGVKIEKTAATSSSSSGGGGYGSGGYGNGG